MVGISPVVVGGVLLGLAAALAQSVSYFCSKLFVIRRGNAVLRLVVLGHLIMGLVSAIVLPILWHDHIPPFHTYAFTLSQAAVYYLLGQACFFMALRYDDASRLSPLLGLKVAFLAVVYVLFLHTGVTPLQWAGAAGTISGAFLMNYSGRRLSWQAMLAVVGACVFYAMSDLNIRWLVDAVRVPGGSLMHATFISVALAYLLSGLIALALLPLAGKGTLSEWHYALPFAISWLVAMGFLFACFATLGVLFGNVVQSTRGLMTVGLGAIIAALGFVRIEEKVRRTVFLCRLAAAALMFLAIAMFALGQPH